MQLHGIQAGQGTLSHSTYRVTFQKIISPATTSILTSNLPRVKGGSGMWMVLCRRDIKSCAVPDRSWEYSFILSCTFSIRLHVLEQQVPASGEQKTDTMGSVGVDTKNPERILKTDLWQYGRRRRNDGPYADNLDIDVLIIGAGFGGAYSLYECRKNGLNAVVYDAGQGFGGTWRWVSHLSQQFVVILTDSLQNVYPGARVDSPVPIYELAIPEVYKDWHWSTNYPGWDELQAYFDHMDKVLDLSRDCAFETVVISAEFDTNEGKWVVKTQDGRVAKARFLIVAAGFAAKRCKSCQYTHCDGSSHTDGQSQTFQTFPASTPSKAPSTTVRSGPQRASTTKARE